MKKNLKIISLDEKAKEETIKQGKKIKLTSKAEVYCPEDYQILMYDPNLLSPESKILTYSSYLSENLNKLKKYAADQSIVNEIIDGIYDEYDNFGNNNEYFKQERNKYFSDYEAANDYARKGGFRYNEQASRRASYPVIKKIVKENKNNFRKLFDDLEKINEKNIIDFLRMRTEKKSEGKSYFNRNFFACKMNHDYMKHIYPRKKINLQDSAVEYLNKQTFANEIKSKNFKLSKWCKQIKDNKICSILKKHKKDDLTVTEAIEDTESLIEELQQYKQNDKLTPLIDYLISFNDKLEDISNIYFPLEVTVLDQIRMEEFDLALKEMTYEESERNNLEQYEEYSVENPYKIKNQSEVFWPIDSNGNELNQSQNFPIVMAKKEE